MKYCKNCKKETEDDFTYVNNKHIYCKMCGERR